MKNGNGTGAKAGGERDAAAENSGQGSAQGAAGTGADSPAGRLASTITPERLEKLGQVRQQLSASFAQVTMALMMTPRYRNLLLRDLEEFVLHPLIHDRIALALPKKPEGAPEAAASLQPVVGIAIWARVSAEADARIREQVTGGVFPVRLKPEDWNSGEIVWLLDVIAPSKPLAAAVLGNFGRLAGKAEVFIHPVAASQVEKEVLQKLRAGVAG